MLEPEYSQKELIEIPREQNYLRMPNEERQEVDAGSERDVI